ncbi:MAG: hypothetical protein A3G18_04645 [Rhodospirillales bacterium RIFCSPLOWO2_12_FULL_58_28]|nr:MAG: hypothetical protein A3H92_09435 [Rhodospirillales bacterium RIFCSPLOWO2_02_FULL_58_16]OHC76930.1 MAG: hypothetical protein A3G18_04645 [Rhodospirillales bacterium RIFCSPLOWO2_12_FULL_58_28]
MTGVWKINMTCRPWLLIMAPLGVFWAYAVFVIDPAYWHSPHEVANLSLGHALNIDQWLEHVGKGRRSHFNLYVHPGVPFQLLSWAVYRLSDPFGFLPAQELMVKTLTDPQAFYLLSRSACLVMTGSAIYLLLRRLPEAPLPIALAIGFSIFAYQPVWQYSLLLLNNQSFGPLAAVIFFVAGLRALESVDAGRRSPWVLFGFIAAVSYTIEMEYFSWTLAAGAGLLAALMVRRLTLRQAMVFGGFFLLGFALGLELASLIMDGKFTHRVIGKMFAFQVSVFLDPESLGTAPTGLGLTALIRGAWFPAATAFGLFMVIGAALIIRLRQGRSDPSFLGWAAPPAVIVLTVFALGIVAYVKLPNPKYLVSSVSFIPVGLYWLYRCGGAATVKALALPVLALAAVAMVREADVERLAKKEEAALIDDRRRILALPLAPGQKRLWTYRMRMPEYGTRLTIQWSAVRSYDSLVDDRLFPDDSEYNIWRGGVRINNVWHSLKDIDWRYAVFNRTNDIQGLPEEFRESTADLIQLDKVTVAVSRNR